MSKAIRIREHLYEEIARRAGEERRSIIGQLEYLLEQALRIDVDAQPRDVEARTVSGGAAQATHPPAASSEDPHFKPDPK